MICLRTAQPDEPILLRQVLLFRQRSRTEPTVSRGVTTGFVCYGEAVLKSYRDIEHVAHPGTLIRDTILPALNMSVTRAARDLCIARQTLHRILSGEAAISQDMAVRLERLFGVPWQFWLERQHLYEIKRITFENRDLLARIPNNPLPESIMRRIGARHDG